VNLLKKYYFPTLFLLVVSLPLINWNGWIIRFERQNENRNFQDTLVLDFSKLDKFPEHFDTYFNDNFSFRTPLLKAIHKIKFNVFHISTDRDDLIFGKDGWYFSGGVDKRIFEGRENFSIEKLQQFKDLWEERLTYLRHKKIKTYWLICPIKHQVYADKLPESVIKKITESRTAKLTHFLKTEAPDLEIINPENYFKFKKKSEILYFKNDNHWNDKAGYEVTKLLLAKFKEDFPELSTTIIDGYTWKQITKNDGIHKASLGISELSEWVPVIDKRTEFALPVKKYGFVSPTNFPYAWKYEMRFKNKEKGKYRILVIRDSFGDAIQPFLKEAFEESVFIFDNWKYKLDKEIIERVNPDIVLYISLESHLDNFLQQP
jgi:hypothetical protein